MAEDSSRKTCDNRSVGVIITDEKGRLLVFDRNTDPPGTAPCAGHVDRHGADGDAAKAEEEAARAEVAEELGLTVLTLTQVTSRWRHNPCRRRPGPQGVGHQWTVLRATVCGDLKPSPRETRNVRWITRGQLRALFERTLELATGTITWAQFEEEPGLDPVWALWFALDGTLETTETELSLVETVHWSLE